ncbi:uncharacterized protein LOC129720213 [Wyeomyia smithii]|uniref:uncharacterized protein LOC129720213 n=1 Tax=Wyeomyia smithii TaxID=174621 RepID=UPI002467AFFC|nr:uncharacterized protein LOC129720213 [Wyeomyia smithii]
MRINMENDASNDEVRKLVRRHKIKLISIAIRDTKRTIQNKKEQKSHLQRKVEEATSADDWVRMKAMLEKRAMNTYNQSKAVEIRKLEDLKNKSIRNQSHNQEWIANTTEANLPDFVERTLMLGPNFNVQNKNTIPYVRMIADVETAIQGIPEAEGIRGEVATFMSNYINYQRQPRTKNNVWIHKEIIRTREYLREHPELYVTKADKENRTVILAADEYRQKMTTMVTDEETYTALYGNPTARTLKKLNLIVEQWFTDGHIDARNKYRLKVYNCHPPRIYGLPKLHKPDRPLRPVVSTVGSATYRMAQYLAAILGKLVGKTEFHVRNSFDFAEEISRVQVPDGYVMYSLDVVSLYTNVPVE